jgi:hypothetical protein
MRSLKETILEAKTPIAAGKSEVRNFIKEHFEGAKYDISSRPNKDGMYEVKLYGKHIEFEGVYSAYHKTDNVTDNKFVITDIDCDRLTIGADKHSLYQVNGIKGLPKKLNCTVAIKYTYLRNLEDLPEEINGTLYIGFNRLLKELTGLEKCKIKDNLIIECNGIESIKGLPEVVNGAFSLDCNSFLNLKGQEQYFPKQVNGKCLIRENGQYSKPKGKTYSSNMIAKLIDVKGEIEADRE